MLFSVIASPVLRAKQSQISAIDCFVASAPRNDRSADRLNLFKIMALKEKVISFLSRFKDWRIATYAMHSIEGMASGVIGIFMPIYFLTLGYSVAQIFIFLLVNYFLLLFFIFITGWFAKKFGLVNTLLIRLLFVFIGLVLLVNLKNWPDSFYAISVLNAVKTAFYWFPLHVIFAKSSENKAMGDHVGKLIALPSLVKLIVPLLGAGITFLFGFKALFIFAGAIYIISIIPFLFISKIPIEVNISFGKIIDYTRRYKKYFIAEFLLSVSQEVENYILPIFLFLTFNDIFTIGLLATFLGLGSAIFTLLIGKYSDRIDRKKFLRAGAIAMVIIWVGRYLAVDELSFYALSILAGFVGVLIAVPFSSIFYINAKNNHIEDFVIFREIPIFMGKMFVYGAGLILISQIKLTFLISIAPYLFLLIF